MAIETVSVIASGVPSASGARYRLTLLPRPDLPPPAPRPAVRNCEAAPRHRSAPRALTALGEVLLDPPADRSRRTLLAADAVVALATALVFAVLAVPPVGVWTWSAIAMLLPATWIGLLAARGAYRHDVVFSPPRRGEVAGVGLLFVAGVATVSYLFALTLPRPLPVAVGAVLAIGSALVRRVVREQVRRQRVAGTGLQRVLVVGHPEPAARVIEALDAAPASGLVAVGAALLSDGTAVTPSYGVPLVADPADLADVLTMSEDLQADAVVLGNDLDISGMSVRHLHGALERRGLELLAAENTQAATWAPCPSEVVGTPLVRLGAPRAPRFGDVEIVLPR
jgi:hypothetical protein